MADNMVRRLRYEMYDNADETIQGAADFIEAQQAQIERLQADCRAYMEYGDTWRNIAEDLFSAGACRMGDYCDHTCDWHAATDAYNTAVRDE